MAHRHETGTSLIEVLITISVLSFGLLGIAGLQISAIANTHIAYQYSQAASLAQSIAENLRANQAAAVAGLYQHSPDAKAPAINKKCSAASCTAAEMAAWNIATWHTALNENLPESRLSITCPTTCSSQSIRLITIYWDAKRNGATGTGCNPASTSDLSCFRLASIP